MPPAKLSSTLKALIKAPHARGNSIPISTKLPILFDSIKTSAEKNGLDYNTWLTLSVSSSITILSIGWGD